MSFKEHRLRSQGLFVIKKVFKDVEPKSLWSVGYLMANGAPLMHLFFHALKISEEEKSEAGIDGKSKRSSCPKCLA